MNLVPFRLPFIAGCVSLASPLGEILLSKLVIFVVRKRAAGGADFLAMLFFGLMLL